MQPDYPVSSQRPQALYPYPQRPVGPGFKQMLNSMPAQMMNYDYSEISDHELRKQKELKAKVEREKREQDKLKQDAEEFVKMLKVNRGFR